MLGIALLLTLPIWFPLFVLITCWDIIRDCRGK